MVQQISPRVKILYSLGEVANSVKLVTFGLYSLFFATSVKGLPGTWIGLVGFFAMLWDAVIDPYIGFLTDGLHAHSRRYRFMLIGALTMGVGYWAFFSPPQNLSAPLLIAWLLIASLVVRTATSMYSIPYAAIGVNLSQDYHERTSVTAFRAMAGIAGTLLTASLSFVLFFPQQTPGVDPKLNPKGYSSMGLAFGVVMTVTALVALWGARLRRSGAEDEPAQVPAAFFTAMWQPLCNPSCRVALTCFSLVVMALAINSSLLVHYLKYYVNIHDSAAMSTSQGIFFGSGFLGTLFWLRISKRVDKGRLYILSASTTALLLMGGPFLFGEGHLFGTGDVRPLLAGYGLVGFVNSVLWFIPPSILADVADENEWLTGRRWEGALFGLLSFSQQAATGLAILIAGVLLDKFVGLVAGNLPSDSPGAAYRIAIVYSVTPALLLLAAAFLMLRYKLTRERVQSIQAQLRERHHLAEAFHDSH